VRRAIRRNKYGVRLDAAGIEERSADGRTFASKRECKRYLELKMLEKAGRIRDLRLQPWFALMVPVFEGAYDNINEGKLVGRKVIGSYRADFDYIDVRGGKRVTEDAKGRKTEAYALRKRMVEAQYGIEITEV
jgi:hypothetical protein